MYLNRLLLTGSGVGRKQHYLIKSVLTSYLPTDDCILNLSRIAWKFKETTVSVDLGTYPGNMLKLEQTARNGFLSARSPHKLSVIL